MIVIMFINCACKVTGDRAEKQYGYKTAWRQDKDEICITTCVESSYKIYLMSA